MRGGPAPSSGLPPAPVGGWLWRVAYVTQRGGTVSRLFRQEDAARRFAALVREHGGRPRLHCTKLSRWTEPEPTP